MSRVPLVLWRKEASLALRSRATWVVFAAVAGLAGALFAAALREAAGRVAALPTVFCGQLALVAPFAAAFFTMGLFARERASGTLEALLTAPVTDAEIVLGKFLSAYSLVLLSLAFSSLSLPVYLHRAAPPPPFAPGHVAWGLAAVALASAAWTAFGVLAAAAARRESAAGVATLAACLAAALLPGGPAAGLPAGSFAASLDLSAFSRGVADTRPAVLLLTCTAFFLFCATRVLESRRWASSR
ncbi:MAG: ABC transporter permease subunit [Kiritimatiellae bacterium]|nr:ABC transporter permease subunit [Kiritimatiellia bacterium]